MVDEKNALYLLRIKKVGVLDIILSVGKGDRKNSAKISEQKPIKFNFYRAVPEDGANLLHFRDELFFCNDKTAPDFRSDSKYYENESLALSFKNVDQPQGFFGSARWNLTSARTRGSSPRRSEIPRGLTTSKYLTI